MQFPDGEIISIDRDEDELIVMFQQPRCHARMEGSWILVYDDSMSWRCLDGFIRLDGEDMWEPIKPDLWSYKFTGEEYSWGGETEMKSYCIDDFQGCWDSKMQRWEID